MPRRFCPRVRRTASGVVSRDTDGAVRATPVRSREPFSAAGYVRERGRFGCRLRRAVIFVVFCEEIHGDTGWKPVPLFFADTARRASEEDTGVEFCPIFQVVQAYRIAWQLLIISRDAASFQNSAPRFVRM